MSAANPESADIPLSRPEIGPAEEEAVLSVLRSGGLAMGARVEALEAAWAVYCGVAHAVFVANGTLAIEALLYGMGVGPGDEVVTVSFSFNATVSATLRVGATPVLVDVSDEDFCMDPRLVEAALTPRTRAIMPVHLYGLPASMSSLQRIADRHGLALIEDAAQAIGARYGDRSVGSLGTAAVFSLYATKAITSGEGGMITTDDAQLAHRLRVFRNQGMEARYRHTALGTNLRPTEIAAALALPQLARIDQDLERRRRNAARLNAGLVGFEVPHVPDGRVHSWHQYTLRFATGRDRIAAGLRGRGIGTGIYYPVPIHRQPYLSNYGPRVVVTPQATSERLASEVLSIPVRASLSGVQIETVIEAVREVAAEGGT